jgi:hypothetical protein
VVAYALLARHLAQGCVIVTKTFSSTAPATAALPQFGARRLFLLGGIALILVGMLFGDIFAVFILHQDAARVGTSLAAAAQAALDGNVAAVESSFQNVGAFLENRGTKVDTHVHMIDFGYLALLLAILEPRMVFSAAAKRRIAWLFLFGAGLLPVGVFLIHYVGLAYSPFSAIGWASVAADFGGFLVLLATAICLIGLALRRNKGRLTPQSSPDPVFASHDAAGRILLGGGLLLVLVGFAGGAYYAAFDLYAHERRDYGALSQMARGAAAQTPATVQSALADYGQLQGDKAVKIAAHAHAIEFGLLAMMLALFQPFIVFRESARKNWAAVLLVGSFLLPVCVLLELRFGLIAGGLADIGGLLVILALLAMWIGILRYTGYAGAIGEKEQAARGEFA